MNHALNGGEEIICRAKLDGYYCSTKTTCQFQGYFWYGFKDCYTPAKINPTQQQYNHNQYNLIFIYIFPFPRSNMCTPGL